MCIGKLVEIRCMLEALAENGLVGAGSHCVNMCKQSSIERYLPGLGTRHCMFIMLKNVPAQLWKDLQTITGFVRLLSGNCSLSYYLIKFRHFLQKSMWYAAMEPSSIFYAMKAVKSCKQTLMSRQCFLYARDLAEHGWWERLGLLLWEIALCAAVGSWWIVLCICLLAHARISWSP